MPQNGMYAPPGLLTICRGGAYIAVFCDECDEGFQAREHSKPEVAHMPQNGMYVPPRKLDHGPWVAHTSRFLRCVR